MSQDEIRFTIPLRMVLIGWNMPVHPMINRPVFTKLAFEGFKHFGLSPKILLNWFGKRIWEHGGHMLIIHTRKTLII
jgi:hypothetical protein